MFTLKTIDRLTNNKEEMLKISSIEHSLDNRRYKSNHRDSDFGDLPFDDDESLIARQWLYRIKDKIIFS